MSSILKALKKLDDDKAVRRPDELKIDAEILRSDNAPRISSTGAVLVSLLLLAGGSGATYLYMKQGRSQEITNQNTTEKPKQNLATVSAVSDIETVRLPPAVVVVPAKPQKTAKSEAPKAHQPPIQAKTPPPATSKLAKPVELLKTPELAKTIKPPTSRTSTSSKTVPALRVNGIAFQDGSANSVAIINGTPASNGSEIDGVKVEEIYKSRVKFSFNGEKFEINLGQSNQSNR